MIFKELRKMPYAKGQLKKLANGQYHSISYEVTEYSSHRIEKRCAVYIPQYDYSVGPTWNDALQALKKQIKRMEGKDNGK